MINRIASVPHRLRLLGALLAALVIVHLSSALSAQDATTELRPFEAVYKTTALGMTLDLTRSLTREGNTYRLTSSGKNFLIKMNEYADFQIGESGVEGIRFESRVKTLKTNNRSVEFDPDNGVIKSMKRGEWSEHVLSPDVLDQFSQQQQLRLTLMGSEEPPQTLGFRVVDGAKISNKTWRRLPDETLETPIGDLKTVRYQAEHKNPKRRASEIWLAPDLDYLMVKTKHVERSSTIRVEIKSLQWLDALETVE